ncbi:MAG: potassium transporter TrkG [Eubacteriales bacterium]|nr:potassium transporter TrkG [Eubacteriales bacterium]
MAVVHKSKSLPKAAKLLNINPTRLIVSSFLIIILIGGVLLTLPFATASGQSGGFLKGLFTSTSAVCVTGLVVEDTATYWSTFGKWVIILLIQIGGLGIVTITSFFYSFLRRKASLKTLVVTQESTASFSFDDVFSLVRRIMFITFTIEGIGAVILSWRFSLRYGLAEGIVKGSFQAVSAFCNAGFDLHGDTVSGKFSSLVAFNNDPIVLITTALLIISGGLGFVVWNEIILFRKNRKVNFHARVVLALTGVLIFVGTIAFLASEWNNHQTAFSLGSLPENQRFVAAFFQAVTPRTAGFNSIDQFSLFDTSKFITVLLMFVGAAPGSTGGGVKITTFAVFVATILSDITGHDEIVISRHRLSRETFTRSLAVLGLGLLIVLVTTMSLGYFEVNALEANRFSFMDLFFEATSAFATVGLSAAGTAQLTQWSWMVLIPAMYLGRVGPASFAISLAMRGVKKREIVHPEGRLLVG